MKTLRILFTILSAICIAAVLPLGAFLGFTWAIALGLLAFFFYLLMLYCKKIQEENEPPEEISEQPQEPSSPANESEKDSEE